MNGLDLFGEGEQIALEIVMFALKAFDRIGVPAEVFAQSRLLLRDLREDLDARGVGEGVDRARDEKKNG